MTRIVIDPITRIEGHLRIDVEVDGGSVKNAWASGQMWRGIENILIGRDPREAWIFTQRFCGVCTTVHAIASVRAVENALQLEIPKNAQYIRNLIVIAHALHDHIVHFYHLSALDWVDVVSALKADPAKASSLAESLSDWPGNGTVALAATKAKLKSFVDAGQLGIFANGYWGHPAMKLPPEVNLLGVHHYLQALDYQRKANEVVTTLGSKTPNIQNLAVGGVANAINLDNQATLNMEKLYRVKDVLDEVVAFVQQVYVPDVCAIGAMYPEWLGYGAGVTNYLAVPDLPLDTKGTEFDLPGGTIMNGDFSTHKPITSFNDDYFRDNVEESIAHAWYDGDWQKHPYEEETVPKHTEYDDKGKYTWVKAPRFQGQPMQVGPLAQVLVGLRRRARAHEAVGGRRPREGLGGRRGEGDARHAPLHPRAARGAGGAHRGHRRAGPEALAAPGGEHRQRRHRHLQRPVVPQRGGAGLRVPRGARAAPSHTGRSSGREDQELPGGRPHHLERQPARREGPEGPLRGLAPRQPDRGPGAPPRGAADHPLLRPLPGLRHPHPRPGGPGDRAGEGAIVTRWRASTGYNWSSCAACRRPWHGVTRIGPRPGTS